MKIRKSKIKKQLILKKCGCYQGFTLIELLISMIVGLIVLGAVYSIFTIQNKQLNNQDQIVEMQQNARIAMNMMSKEIMMAGYGRTTFAKCQGTTTASNAPCVGITAANADSISFAMDLNTDGDYDDPNENVSYFLDTSGSVPVLKRSPSTSASGQPVVENVTSLSFTYLDEAGASCTSLNSGEPKGNSSCTGSGTPYACCTGSTTGTCNGIRTIQISITTRTAKIDPELGSYRTFTLTSYVTPRNLGLSGY